MKTIKHMAEIKKQKTVYLKQAVHDKLKDKAKAKGHSLCKFLEDHLNKLAEEK